MDTSIINGSTTSAGSPEFNFDSLENFQGENGAQNSTPSMPAGQSDSEKPLELPEVDPKYANLSREEAMLRTYQSRYDSLNSRYESLVKETEADRQYRELLESLQDDPNLYLALGNQLHPGLIPQKDFSTTIKESLAQEFGKDYKPKLTRHEAEMEDPGGMDWKYYRKLDKLTAELENGGVSQERLKSVQSYKEAKLAKQKAEEEEFQREVQEVKLKYKLEDKDIQRVLKFGESLKFSNLVKLVRFLDRFPSISLGGLNNAPGQPANTVTERQGFIKEIFNKP